MPKPQNENTQGEKTQNEKPQNENTQGEKPQNENTRNKKVEVIFQGESVMEAPRTPETFEDLELRKTTIRNNQVTLECGKKEWGDKLVIIVKYPIDIIKVPSQHILKELKRQYPKS